MQNRLKLLVACFALLCVLAAIGWRVISKYQVPGPFNPEKQGFCDFHNGVYFPALAFREGISPFGERFASNYEIERPIAPHAPFLFALHVPLTWLGLRTAEIVFYGLMAIQLLLISWLSWLIANRNPSLAAVVGLAAAIAASRAGYGTLFTGYFTFELILGALCAIHFGDRHRLGAIGLAFCCAKPTYGIPLAILMVARGQWRSLFWGIGLAAVLTFLTVGWLVMDSSIAEFWADIKSAQENHRMDENELPVNSWTRVDALGITAKWLRWNPDNWEYLIWMVPIMSGPVWLLWRTKSNPGLQGAGNIAGLVMVLAMIAGLYRQHYDLLLLVPPLLALGSSLLLAAETDTKGQTSFGITSGVWEFVPNWQRWLMLTGGALVLFNYLTAQVVLERLSLPVILKDAITSLNGVVILAMLILACNWLFKLERMIRS